MITYRTQMTPVLADLTHKMEGQHPPKKGGSWVLGIGTAYDSSSQVTMVGRLLAPKTPRPVSAAWSVGCTRKSSRGPGEIWKIN